LNKNLFSIASSLQTEWMVNFTPFKSAQFKSSAFGLIPKDWNVGKLGDVIELLDSKRIPLSGQERENMEKIYPYYGAASLMDYVDDYIFDGIYLLIGEDGTVIDDKGFPILQYVWGKFWVNNHAHIVKGKNGFNVDSLYLLLSKTNIQSIVTGAVQAKVNQNNLKSIEIIIPPVEVMEKFNELIKPFFDTIRSNHDEIKELQKLRDTLLPKLMSGEIDVSKINCDLE
ncbi:MAG: restriction endonuclease subunit S, partial [Methanobrevibacter sp.]|uniref:restriction endonuclease subunit S n=1 Tax=Methanobrevibacter sp. TaxID=66852 RepID=UPI0025DC1D4A